MTDAEILENYAREFVDVLKAYTGNDFEINRDLDWLRGGENYLAIICDDGCISFLLRIFGINNLIFGKAIRVKNNVTGDVFYDCAPFEQKKEVSCED
jgi:hypothetical protein